MLITHHDLPDEYTKRIGSGLIKWAYLETYIQNCCYLLLGVDGVVGRIAIREPRLPDRITMLEEIGYLRGFDINEKTLAQLRKQITDANRWRDLFAHGTWTDIPERGWCVRDVRGNLPQAAGYKGHLNKRKFTPQARPVNIELLDNFLFNVNALISSVRELQINLEGMIEAQRQQAQEQAPDSA
ncbi:MAG: hypothetical protein SGJ21_04525 [Alphaproteobacteria bacterium]|nr:hypothetical protein [Alphaproteobacteria bacterium]